MSHPAPRLRPDRPNLADPAVQADPAEAASQRQPHDALRLAVRTIFDAPQGELVLRHLKSRALIGRSPFSRNTQALELAFIEGRRSLVWELERLLEQ